MSGESKKKREVTITLAGEALTLSADCEAIKAVAEALDDPLAMGREILLDECAINAGVWAHQPRFKFSTANIPLFIHIGAVAAGSELTLEDVEALVFREGFYTSRDRALEYLGLLLSPPPDPSNPNKELSELRAVH